MEKEKRLHKFGLYILYINIATIRKAKLVIEFSGSDKKLSVVLSQ